MKSALSILFFTFYFILSLFGRSFLLFSFFKEFLLVFLGFYSFLFALALKTSCNVFFYIKIFKLLFAQKLFLLFYGQRFVSFHNINICTYHRKMLRYLSLLAFAFYFLCIDICCSCIIWLQVTTKYAQNKYGICNARRQEAEKAISKHIINGIQLV